MLPIGVEAAAPARMGFAIDGAVTKTEYITAPTPFLIDRVSVEDDVGEDESGESVGWGDLIPVQDEETDIIDDTELEPEEYDELEPSVPPDGVYYPDDLDDPDDLPDIDEVPPDSIPELPPEIPAETAPDFYDVPEVMSTDIETLQGIKESVDGILACIMLLMSIGVVYLILRAVWPLFYG